MYDLEDHLTSSREERAGELEDDSGQPNALSIEKAREFAYERDLQNFLARNLETLEEDLRLYEDEGLEAVEFLAGDGRRIDILAVDAENRFVVIELKVSRGYDRVVGQIARYMAWISKNMETDKLVRGIIVANHITDDLKLAASMLPNITLAEYRMHFEIRRL